MFITELVDLTYKCRQEYEFSQGDWGFMSDDYTPVLQVRVVNMEGRELFVTKQTDAIVSVAIAKSTDDLILYRALDSNYQIWEIKKQKDEYQITLLYKLEEILKKHNIYFSDFIQKYDDLLIFAKESFVVLEESNELKIIPFKGCMSL